MSDNNSTLFVKTDGTLWGMGRNYYGQLGDATYVDRITPVRVASGVASVQRIDSTSLFLKSDGTLWGMGHNDFGQLGKGLDGWHSIPVQVASGVASVFTGSSLTLFLKTDRTLWGMGDNSDGFLGNPATYGRIGSPVNQISSGVLGLWGVYGSLNYLTEDHILWRVGNGVASPQPLASHVATMLDGLIQNLPTAPAIEFVSSEYHVEGRAGSVILTVKRSGEPRGACSVSYATVGFTAIEGTDFTAARGTLEWLDGETGDKTIAVPVADRGFQFTPTNGLDSAFDVALLRVSGNIGVGAPARVTIHQVVSSSNAPTFQLETTAYTVGATIDSLTVPVILNSSHAGDVTINYTTESRSAVAGQDYTTTAGTRSGRAVNQGGSRSRFPSTGAAPAVVNVCST